MNILHINKFLYPFGGAESYMFGLAKAQSEGEHQVKFWGMQDDRNIVEDEYSCFASKIDYSQLSNIQKLKMAFATIYSAENRKKISVFLDSFNPDIVHIHNYNFQLTPSILPEIKKRGIKIVQTVHDSQMVCPWHRLYNFQKESTCTKCVNGSFFYCVKDRCFNGSMSQSILGAAESLYYHKLDYYNKYLSLIISPSQFLADLIKRRVDTKIEVVPNFTDFDTLGPTDEYEEYVLYFGRISGEKGVVELQSVFTELKIKLKIVGKGPEEANLRPNDYIEFLGPKYGNELRSIIKKAKFVIQPSKWYENCPMTVIESFACGTPVIAANHSGFIELISDGENGFLMDFYKQEETKNKIGSVFENYDLSLRSNSLSTFKRRFNKQIHLNKVNSIYKQLM